MKLPIIALLTVCSQIALSQALYTSKDDVNLLTPQTFGPAVMDTNVTPIFVFFFFLKKKLTSHHSNWLPLSFTHHGVVTANDSRPSGKR